METPDARSQKKLVGPCVICGVEGVEVRFRRFTKDAYYKALQHGTLASTWVLNVSQFCHSHYMSYIVHGTDKDSETSKNVVPSKRRLMQGEAVTTAERPFVLMLFSCRDWKQTYQFIEKGYCDVSKSFRYI